VKSRPIAIVGALMVLSSGIGAVATVSCAIEDKGSTSLNGPKDAASDTDGDPDPGDEVDSGEEITDEPEIAVTAGTQTTCTTQRNGAVHCWGFNTYGQFGNGTSGAASPIATTATGLSAKQVAAGNQHQCAVTTDGQVKCWGGNASLQLGHPQDQDNDGGRCAGTVPCNRTPITVNGTSGALAVTAGNTFSCVRSATGISCWGTGTYGEIGAIEGGGTNSVTPNALSLTGVDAIVSGYTFTCAHKAADGTVWCWGRRQFGEIGHPENLDGGAPSWDDDKHPVPQAVPGLSSTRAVAAGPNHACVIQSDKTVSCWGANRIGVTGGGYLGHDPATDSPCKVPGYCNDKPTKVAGLASVRELALGLFHSCALRDDDTVACWGQNDLGRLGHDPALDGDGGDSGTALAVITPKTVTGLANVAHISARYNHTCAVTRDSKVYCWGSNASGELGQLDAGSSFKPVEVQGL